MITVHHLNHSRSQRILWLLEELELPYEIQRYERDPRTLLAPPELRRVHPLGKSPVITDGELVLAESGAIIEYLSDRYGAGRLLPAPGTAARLRCTYWLHYAEGSAMPPLLLKLVFSRLPKGPAPFFVKPLLRSIAAKAQRTFVDPQLKTHLNYLEAALAAHPWFGGESFTAADIQMSFPLEAAGSRAGLTAAAYPRLWDFLQRIQARPAYRRALERGGPHGVVE